MCVNQRTHRQALHVNCLLSAVNRQLLTVFKYPAADCIEKEMSISSGCLGNGTCHSYGKTPAV
jgi:hypothetical protein